MVAARRIFGLPLTFYLFLTVYFLLLFLYASRQNSASLNRELQRYSAEVKRQVIDSVADHSNAVQHHVEEMSKQWQTLYAKVLERLNVYDAEITKGQKASSSDSLSTLRTLQKQLRDFEAELRRLGDSKEKGEREREIETLVKKMREMEKEVESVGSEAKDVGSKVQQLHSKLHDHLSTEAETAAKAQEKERERERERQAERERETQREKEREREREKEREREREAVKKAEERKQQKQQQQVDTNVELAGSIARATAPLSEETETEREKRSCYAAESHPEKCKPQLMPEGDVKWPLENTAIFTMASGGYWQAPLVLMQSLRDHHTRIPHLIILTFSDERSLPDDFYAAAERLGVEVWKLERMKMTENIVMPAGWHIPWNKLQIWKFTQFSKVIWMDSDTMVLENIDNLLDMPDFTAAQTPQSCCQRHIDTDYQTISGGLFITEPSEETFKKMMDISSKQSPDPEDLAQHNGSWWWGDMEVLRVLFDQIEDRTHRLDTNVYDVPVGHCDCTSNFKYFKPRTMHFVCMLGKPWHFWQDNQQGMSNPECTKRWISHWENVYNRALGKA